VPDKKTIFLAIITLVLLAVPIFSNGPFYLNILILVYLNALMAGAWNVLGGYAGQVSLGHAMFFGIGAYASTMFYNWWGISPWVGMLMGGVIAVVVSLFIGWPCFRLKGHYFTIGTIAIAEIIITIFVNWDLVQGARGVYLPILEPSLKNFQFVHKTGYYYIAFFLMVVMIVISYIIERSKLGFYLKAIREQPDAARALGVNIQKYKMIAMLISAFFTALAGTFYAQYVLYIDPYSVLHLMLSVQICLVAVFGGVGTVWGPVLGAFILMPLSELTRSYLGGTGTGLDLIIYGLLIMLVAVYQPWGLMGLFKKLRIFKETPVTEGFGEGVSADESA